ncbi:MAG: ScpA family protein [Candidatus Paceibacterota bacterium]
MEVVAETTKDFRVKLEGFEGPLELLLSLIEKRKLPINDVSLASVTDDYIKHIEASGHFPLSQTSHFILIASTLLLIKSKSLLPTLDLTPEEEESIESLEKRLKLYKRNKELSLHVSTMLGKRMLFEAHEAKRTKAEVVFSPSEDASIDALKESILGVLKRLPKAKLVAEAVVRKVVSIEDMIENLTKRITQKLSMSFSEFSNMGKAEKVEVIVGFLAMLELAKQGIINLTQEKTFADITMESDSVGVPKYE